MEVQFKKHAEASPSPQRVVSKFVFTYTLLWILGGHAQARINLGEAAIVIRPGELPRAERSAAVVLTEEIAKRTGFRLSTSAVWPEGKTVIAISSETDVPTWERTIPVRRGEQLPEQRRKDTGFTWTVRWMTRP